MGNAAVPVVQPQVQPQVRGTPRFHDLLVGQYFFVGRQKSKINFEWYCFAQRRWVSGVGRLIAQALPLFAAQFLQN